MSDSSPAASQTPSQPVATDQGTPAPAATPVPAAAAAVPSATAQPVKTDPPAAAATPAPEAKPAEAAKPAEPAPAPAPAPVPEFYELAPPQGVKFDEEFAKQFGPILKDAKLSKAAGEKLVSTFLDFQKAAPARALARDLEVTMKDPVLGGMNWGKTSGYVQDALTAFTTPEFRSQLERWGVANNLEFVRVFASIGRAMRGDTPSRGQPDAAPEESVADRMYRKAVKPNASAQ